MNRASTDAGTLNAVLYVVMLAAAVAVARRAIGDTPRPTRAAAAMWLLVAVPSVVQLVVPGLEPALRRDPELIIRHGQVWRLLTGLVVQDGGAAGLVFNLVVLALVAIPAATFWGPRRVWVLFLVGHLVVTLLVLGTFRTVGAGSSFATFALATSMVGASLAKRRLRQQPVPALALVCGAAAMWLLVLGDPHGLAVLTGLALGSLSHRQARVGRPAQRVAF